MTTQRPLIKTEGRAAARVPEGLNIKLPQSYLGTIYGLEEVEAVVQVMQQEWLTNGPNVAAFEREFAAYTGTDYAFAVSNCTQALHMCSQVFDIGPGDEVITTPLTFVATAQPIVEKGATAVFADIDPRTLNIDPLSIAEKITPRTKAIFLVHEAGLPCDMDPIMELARKHNLVVIEDCARAVGATYRGQMVGSFGDAGAFSFHSVKNMSTLGEGGMITSNRLKIAEEVPLLRYMGVQYTWEVQEQEEYWLPFTFDVIELHGQMGHNYRMNEAQAAVGRVQLRKLNSLNEKRRELAHYLNAGFADIPGITVPYEPREATHVFHLYQIELDEDEIGGSRDDLMRLLARETGIQVATVNLPIYQHQIFRDRGYEPGLCPNAEQAFSTCVRLPFHPRLAHEQLDYMIDSVRWAVQCLRERGGKG